MICRLTYNILNTGDEELSSLVSQMINLLDEGPYKVYVYDLKKGRSLAGNRYMWGVVYKAISDYTGYTAKQIHEASKKMFLNPEYVTINGQEIEITGSTAKSDSPEFWQYIERIRVWYMENVGLRIPLPNELSDDELAAAYDATMHKF